MVRLDPSFIPRKHSCLFSFYVRCIKVMLEVHQHLNPRLFCPPNAVGQRERVIANLRSDIRAQRLYATKVWFWRAFRRSRLQLRDYNKSRRNSSVEERLLFMFYGMEVTYEAANSLFAAHLRLQYNLSPDLYPIIGVRRNWLVVSRPFIIVP